MLTSGWTGNDLLQVEACPKELAIVKFGNVELTNICQILTPTQAQNQPEVSWTTAPEKLYSIFMMDPDAPSRQDPKYREWYHWGVLNIPGTKINEGQIIADYIGAGPPKGTVFGI
ncbi:phosphatidylethanolamine-binding protein 1-like [Clavelina lepadiformis]|uniref:phosphatidylethanolamine-binding protein 1-like n=1 Tax=Clavelina lepadiformis TaxID=159417 RepID=UPI0040426D15